MLLDQRGQSVDSKTEIRIAACDIDLVSSGEIAQHDRNPRNTASNVTASAPLYISTSEPEMWTFAAI